MIINRNADLKYGKLIEKSILEDLSRKAENWSSQDRIRVAEDLWQKSYAEEFQQYLNQHISQHFPKLVIPQAIERFEVFAGNSIAQWAVQTTTAILNSSEENYQQESEKISRIKTSLEQFLEVSDANLRKPFEEKVSNLTVGKSVNRDDILELIDAASDFLCIQQDEASQLSVEIDENQTPSPDGVLEFYIRIDIPDGQAIINQKTKFVIKRDIPLNTPGNIKQLGLIKDMSSVSSFNRI